MADISMCLNIECLLCKHCYRYMAKSSGQWQAYLVNDPNTTCQLFWPLEDME